MSGSSGKVALVTGGASGIGRASAIEFARQGFSTIVIADIDERGAEETGGIIRAGLYTAS
jgi:NAD(P)-dependent dehydrogenase (short-subunit alcohol dehydrogenase family)